MCDTKREIAEGFKALLKDRTIRKITVSVLMDSLNMTRQSFYYHFQDIYDVMEWICNHEFVSKLAYREDESFEEWFDRALNLLESDRLFYRKVIEELDRSRIIATLLPPVEEQVRRLLLGNTHNMRKGKKSVEINITVRFLSNSIIYHMMDYVDRKGSMKPQEIRCFMNYSLKSLNVEEKETMAV